MFENKLFSQQYKGNLRSKLPADRSKLNPRPNPSTPIPPPAPGIAFNAPPGAGVKAGPEPAKGHPEGLALTPARTAPHCQSREQGKITAPPMSEGRDAVQFGVHDEQESSYDVQSGLVDHARRIAAGWYSIQPACRMLTIPARTSAPGPRCSRRARDVGNSPSYPVFEPR